MLHCSSVDGGVDSSVQESAPTSRDSGTAAACGSRLDRCRSYCPRCVTSVVQFTLIYLQYF